MEEYFDESYCTDCQEWYTHFFHIHGHERDSSYDYKTCLQCGLESCGLGVSTTLEEDDLNNLRNRFEKEGLV